jgi:hypothetical protein
MELAPATRGRLILAICALVSVLLVGCARVEVYDASANAALAVPTVEPIKADSGLRILAIDFDPPLSSLTSPVNTTQLTLLVAVENAGLQGERDVAIRVELWQGIPDREPVMTRTEEVPIITPGEVRVVSFTGIADLQPYPTYWLKVEAISSGQAGASPESQRVYRIRLGQ